MLFEIKHRITGNILFKLETKSLKLCVEAAVTSDAYLSGANLYDANLSGAYLRGAKLVGDRPIFQVGPIGSRSDYLIAYITDKGIMLRAGCFFGTAEIFKSKLLETHGSSCHAEEYLAALTLIETHVKIYPAK